MRAGMYRALFVSALLASASAELTAQALPAPEQFAGHVMGADRKLVRWERIVEYLKLVDQRSDRVSVESLGKTTLGNEFIVVLVSAPENLARLQHYREMGRRVASGRSSDQEARALSSQGRVFVAINHNIHSTEIGSSQTTLEMIHRLATDDSPEAREIRDNVILVHVPSANPDGQIMVVDWYNRNLGTPFETSPMPWLYHHYVGHDNNRDLFMGNMIETRYLWRVFYQDNALQVLLDQHQQGGNGARIFVPPYPDPPNERVHPLIWQQTRFFGAAMAAALQAAGRKGVQNQGSAYRLYHQGGTASAWWHNIIKLLTETASPAMATPVTLRAEDLRVPPGDGPVSNMKVSQSYPDPWPGGVWRLRDVVEYQMIAAMAVLTHAARYRSDLLYGQHVMARDAIQGAASGPFAWLVAPDAQRDPPTAIDMVQRLIDQGIEAQRASAAFQAGGKSWPAGTFVLPAAQAARPVLTDLLGVQHYPELRRYEGGPPIRPYDVTGYTLPLQMGVSVEAVNEPFQAALEPVTRAEWQPEAVAPARAAYVLNHEINRTFLAVNRLLAADVPVFRSREPLSAGGRQLSAGAFIVPVANAETSRRVQTILTQSGIPAAADPAGLPSLTGEPGLRMRKPRVALYKPWVASMDEGWTRWLLEQYDFDVHSLTNDEVRAGQLQSRFDVVVIPSQISVNAILSGYSERSVPAEYAGGIGNRGVENLRTFASRGGTLVALGDAAEFVIQHFNVAVVNALSEVQADDFFSPGSILRLTLDTTHPLAWGLPAEVPAKYMNSTGFELRGTANSLVRDTRIIARYSQDKPLLMSGLLIGEDRLKGKGAIVEMRYGLGRIVLLGFAVQHRGQTHGTFKLLFNSLYYGMP